jgi:tripartite-type tricarboxylate transporter receptor subunit TctC
VARIAWAQSYPTRPVKVIVPFPPGGPTDVMARLVADKLAAALGRPFVIENRPGGAGGIVGVKTTLTATLCSSPMSARSPSRLQSIKTSITIR